MCDGNFTQIPNALLESLYRLRLSGADFCVLLFVIRFTVGFNREFHAMSVGFIATGTGLPLSTVKDSLRRLKKQNLIISRKGSGSTNELAINSECIVSSSTENHSTEIRTSTENRPINGTKNQPQEIKELNKKMLKTKKIYIRIFKKSSTFLIKLALICREFKR